MKKPRTSRPRRMTTNEKIAATRIALASEQTKKALSYLDFHRRHTPPAPAARGRAR